MTNDPRERLSVLKFPFRAVTPKTGRTGLSASRCASSGAFISSTMMVMMAITPSLNTSSRPGDTKILLTINDTFLCQWIDPGLRTFGLWIAKARKKRGSEVSTPILLGPSGAAVSRQVRSDKLFRSSANSQVCARILYTRNLEIARLAVSQLKPQLIFSRSSKCSIRGKVEIPDYFRSRKAKPATYCSQAIALNELRRLG